MNFIRGTIDGDKFVTETLKLTIPEEKLAVLKTQESLHKPIVMGIRPEDIHPDAQEENNISAKISVAELTVRNLCSTPRLGARVSGPCWCVK